MPAKQSWSASHECLGEKSREERDAEGREGAVELDEGAVELGE